MRKVIGTAAIVMIAFLYVPIVAVVAYSFNASPVSYRWDGLTLDWYVELLQDEPLLATLRTSLLLGVLAGAVATAIGFLSAYALHRFPIRGKGVLLAAVAIPLVIPEIVIGVALLRTFSTVGLQNGLLTLVLGHIVIALPMATFVLLGAMRSLDPSVHEAAADLGAGALGTFWRVTLPILRPAILAAFLLSFTTSFSNIVISTFTAGVGTTTLPIRIYSSVRTGLTPELNALGSLMVVLTLVVILVVGVGQMRRILAGSVPGSGS